MIKKILLSLIILTSVFGCEKAEFITDSDYLKLEKTKKEKKDKKDKKDKKNKTFTAALEVNAEDGSSSTRAYDGNLVWHWEYGDALLGYQIAAENIRNRLEYNIQNGLFGCPDFTYQSNKEEKFHFVYPHGAEYEKGKLKPFQEGIWRPVCFTTTEPTKIDALPTLKFEQLSSALELRIWNKDNTSMQERVVSAILTSEDNFAPVWTLDESTMTYIQSLNGKNITINGLNTSVVQINMPHLPDGYSSDIKIKLVLTREDGKTMTTYLPSELTFVKQKRTVYNLIFIPDPTFTCATYNVDGLPTDVLGIKINGDGPGENGSKEISTKIANTGWDILAFQENFTYNTQLKSSLTSKYIFGTHKTFDILKAAFGISNTDGLGFATLSATSVWSNEIFVKFNEAYGDLFNGANTCIDKGFRYYKVTLADGVEIDVYSTHMNSGSSDGHINARASQFQQLAEYINDHRSGRPIVIMGDFNARYTRDDYKTNFWDILHQDLYANLKDAWTELIWDGYYPEYGTPSWVVDDKWDPNNTVGDIWYNDQEGEVVDKILYINDPNSDVRIFAKKYKRDMNFKGLADHIPVVVEFGYEKVR